MNAKFGEMRSLQHELIRAQEQMRFLTESPCMRMAKDMHETSLRHQQLLQMTLSPLKNELERHRVMMDAAKLSTFTRDIFPSVTFLMKDQLLQDHRVLAEMQSLTRPNLAAELNHMLPDRTIWKHIREQQTAFEQMRLQAAMVSEAFQSIKWAQELATRPTLFASTHINETARLITKWEEAGRTVLPLAASIAVAESQSVTQESEILVYPEVFEFEQIEVEVRKDDGFLPTHNLYHVQRTELIYVARSNPEFLADETVLDSLGTTKYFSCAMTICGYITEVNRLCKAVSRDPIFKLTEQLLQSLVALPTIYAVRRNHFCEFIDHLYFIVYEGAGKDNLRFLELISKDDSEPVWMLKHLRNYYSRHDVEHGKDREIRKKQERLGEIFLELLGKPQPRTREDFTKAQLVFLQRIEGMLRLIYETIEQQAITAFTKSGGVEN